MFGISGLLFVLWSWIGFGDKWAIFAFSTGGPYFGIENGPGSTAFGFGMSSVAPGIQVASGKVLPSRQWLMDPAMQIDAFGGRLWVAHWLQLIIYVISWMGWTYYLMKPVMARLKEAEQAGSSDGGKPHS